MSMNDLGGTHRHPNEPDMGVRRVLPCVKCGDRHTVDVTAILEEGRRSNRPADASGGREGLRLRLTGEMLSEIDAMWPHAGAGPFAATVDWDEYEEFAATPPDLRPADASGGGEAEPTCRDCGLTREQIDWGWHSAPYEGQFATPPPAPEENR